MLIACLVPATVNLRRDVLLVLRRVDDAFPHQHNLLCTPAIGLSNGIFGIDKAKDETKQG